MKTKIIFGAIAVIDLLLTSGMTRLTHFGAYFPHPQKLQKRCRAECYEAAKRRHTSHGSCLRIHFAMVAALRSTIPEVVLT